MSLLRRWKPESPEEEVAVQWFRRHGRRRFRATKSTVLSGAFWADDWLVLLQVNPATFPDPITHDVRQVVEEECQRDGDFSPVAIVWVRSAPPDEPEVVKVKNMPDHISHVSQLPRMQPTPKSPRNLK